MPMTIATAVERIANLTPTYLSPNLKGEGAHVCSPLVTTPPELRELQAERTEYYMTHDWTEGHRVKPDHAPRYYVTSYSHLIAYVTLDGTTVFPEVCPGQTSARLRAVRRHQDMVRAAWPERFPAHVE